MQPMPMNMSRWSCLFAVVDSTFGFDRTATAFCFATVGTTGCGRKAEDTRGFTATVLWRHTPAGQRWQRKRERPLTVGHFHW